MSTEDIEIPEKWGFYGLNIIYRIDYDCIPNLIAAFAAGSEFVATLSGLI